MPSCCGGAACFCKITGGSGVRVTGEGSPTNPYEIQISTGLQAADNTVFDLTLTGAGTAELPWRLEVTYADTARLADIPDVAVDTATDGEVLAWDAASQLWVPAPPATATPGLIKTDGTLTGDGSTGNPLKVKADPLRMVRANDPAGVGLSNGGMAGLVQHFPDSATRSAMAPGPVLNQLTMLDTRPGTLDWWDGSAWIHGSTGMRVIGGEWQQLSGPWTSGSAITHVLKHVTDTPANLGGVSSSVNVLFPGDYPSGAGGILTVQITPIGVPVYIYAVYYDNPTNQIRARVRNDAGGDVGQDVTFFVDAWFY